MLIRGCHTLHIIGADQVEVMPAYDAAENAVLAGASLLFELLCVANDSGLQHS